MSRPRKKQTIPRKKGFTLLEILIVIGIMAILAAFILLFINPMRIFREARDTQRISDINTLENAINHAFLQQTLSNNLDPDGSNHTDSCAGEANPKVFVSIPTSTDPLPSAPQGWSFVRASTSTPVAVNGSGWMPMDLTTVSGGSPIPRLPVDPINTFASGMFYTYTCSRNPGFALSANLLESDKYKRAGENDKVSTDGGYDPDMYERGTRRDVNPLAPVGYWALDEGSGTTANDSSKNKNTGTLINFTFTGNSNWVDGVSGKALSFEALRDDYVRVPDPGLGSVLDMTDAVTTEAWVNIRSIPPASNWYYIVSKGSSCSGRNYLSHINQTSAKPSFSMTNDLSACAGRTANTSLAINQWYHVAAAAVTVGNDTQVAFYINGRLDGTATITGAKIRNGINNTEFRIAYTGTGRMDGIIDEVRIYNRALLPAEIRAHYEALK